MAAVVVILFVMLARSVVLSSAEGEAIGCNTRAEGLANDISSFVCPPGCASSPTAEVWGTGIYRNLSSICQAAVHDGRISDDVGGHVIVVRQPASRAFPGSRQNGVTSKTYESGDFSWSFSFNSVIETPIMCPPPPTYKEANRDPTSPPYYYGDKVSYLCENVSENPETGEGPFVLVCGLDGTWKGDESLCTDDSQTSTYSANYVGAIAGVVTVAVLIVVYIIIRRRCFRKDSKFKNRISIRESQAHYSHPVYTSIIHIPSNPVVADQGLAEQMTNENPLYDQPANSGQGLQSLTNGREHSPTSANHGVAFPGNVAEGEVDCTLYNQTDHTYTPLRDAAQYAKLQPADDVASDVASDVAHLYATVSPEEGVVDNIIYEPAGSHENDFASTRLVLYH